MYAAHMSMRSFDTREGGCIYLHDHVESLADLVAGRAEADPCHAAVHAGDAGGRAAVAAEEPGVVRKVRAEALARRGFDVDNVRVGEELNVPAGVHTYVITSSRNAISSLLLKVGFCPYHCKTRLGSMELEVSLSSIDFAVVVSI